MLHVSLTISSHNLENRLVTWAIEPSNESYGNYEINLFRSELYGSGLDFSSLVSGINLGTTLDYIDVTISGYHTHSYREFWYYGQVRNLTTGETRNTLQATLETPMDYVARTVLRDKNIGLREVYGGKEFLILKRKTYGDSCSVCYDEYLQRRSIDFCSGCYDTMISGGYYTPIQIRGMMNPSPKKSQMMLWGDFKTDDSIFYTTSYPHIQPKDIVIDKNNRRWQVIQVRTLEKGLYIIEQDCQIRRVPFDDIIYTFPIDEYWSV